ncbi:MAG TPA: hypothetical protein VMU50_18950, partial [Polyangia bacterium]|nr:hypothetical protein [Polyangia bacterium]
MSRCPLSSFVIVAATVLVALPRFAAAADPPPPVGAHPRLFLNATTLPALAASAQTSGTASARFLAACQDVIANPGDYAMRGGVDSDTWPNAAWSCAFAYAVTKDAQYLAPAIKYWIASLEDDQTLGDKKGCVADADPNWQTWKNDGTTPAPPVILTVTHDTGYPMRWYGPFISLTYD